MFLSGGSMYETLWWGALVKVWEVIVYNSVMDLQQCWQVRCAPILPFAFSLHSSRA